MFFKTKSHFENQVSEKVVETAEHLMVQIGTEIHDDVIQRLSLIRLHIDNINRHINNPVQIQKTIIEMTADFENAINSIRALSHRLMPSQFEHESLDTQIQEICRLFEKSTRRVFHYSLFGSEHPLNKNIKLNLLRICQEIIQNSIRHSHAWNIWISFKWSGATVEIEIEDDGTSVAKLNQTISELDIKNNSIRIRAKSIGALVSYTTGRKGLITKVKYNSQDTPS